MSRVDIRDLVEQMCDRLGVKASYVYKIEIEAGGDATIHLFKGIDGRCEGHKYVVDENGEPATGRFRKPDEGPFEPATETIHVRVLV
jgi:hypothetical protein